MLFRLRSAVIVAGLLAIGLCPPRETVSAHEGHAALPSTGVIVDGRQILISAEAVKAIRMETAKIGLGDLREVLTVPAKVELPKTQQARLASIVSGKIVRVAVKPGETVREGETLVEIQSLELERLQFELMRIAGELDILEGTAIRQKELINEGGLAGKALLQTEANLKSKRSERQIVREKILALGISDAALREAEQSGTTVNTIPLVAPISGTVRHVDARPGQLVDATDHLVEIVDLSRLRVIGEILEADAYQVQPGLPVSIAFSSSGDRPIAGTIAMLDPVMDAQRRVLRTIVEVENDDRLRPGMFGRMTIEVLRAEKEIVCPLSALIERENATFVLVREGEGKFTAKPVEIGHRGREFALITKGLFPGQEVITRGTHLLASMFDGTDVLQSQVTTVATEKSPRAAPAPTTNVAADRVDAATASAELPVSQKAYATSLIEGRLRRVLTRPGDKVVQGQILAEVESQELRTMQLELVEASQQASWTEREIERLRPLADTEGTIRRELWEKEIQLKTLRSRQANLKQQLTLSNVDSQVIESLALGDVPTDSIELGVALIVSPLSGVVSDLRHAIGENIHANDAIFEIQNASTLWIRALILETDAHRIVEGQSAVVRFSASPTLRREGAIVRMSPQLISRERVLPVWIEVSNEDGFLKEGMRAHVEVLVPKITKPVAKIH